MIFPAYLRVGLFFLVFSLSLSGQETTSSRYVAAEIANDVFYLPLKTDRYFTSGLRFEWGSISHRRLARMGNNKVTNSRYWRIDQDLFTPNAIDSLQVMPGDRPFASYLTLSRGRVTDLPGLGFRLRRQWTVGVLGKPSFGGRMQNAFHGMIDFAEEIPGWVNEVNPDVVLNYTLAAEKDFALGPHHRFTLSSRGRLGTLYTDFRSAGTLLLRPVRFGSTADLYLELTAGGRLVAHNATLTGGLLNQDDRYRGVIRPRRLVSDLGAKTGLRLGDFRLEGGVRWLSPEFRGGGEHLWAWFGARY